MDHMKCRYANFSGAPNHAAAEDPAVQAIWCCSAVHRVLGK